METLARRPVHPEIWKLWRRLGLELQLFSRLAVDDKEANRSGISSLVTARQKIARCFGIRDVSLEAVGTDLHVQVASLISRVLLRVFLWWSTAIERHRV